MADIEGKVGFKVDTRMLGFVGIVLGVKKVNKRQSKRKPGSRSKGFEPYVSIYSGSKEQESSEKRMGSSTHIGRGPKI